MLIKQNQDGSSLASLIRFCTIVRSVTFILRKDNAAVSPLTRATRASMVIGRSPTNSDSWPITQTSRCWSKTASTPDSLMSMECPFAMPPSKSKVTGILRLDRGVRGMKPSAAEPLPIHSSLIHRPPFDACDAIRRGTVYLCFPSHRSRKPAHADCHRIAVPEIRRYEKLGRSAGTRNSELAENTASPEVQQVAVD